MPLFAWKTHLPAVIAVILCLNLWLQNGDLREEVGTLKQEIQQLTSGNEALVLSNRELHHKITLQNEAIKTLRAAAEAQQAAAVSRADSIHQALPRKIQKDLASGTAPKEMNQWLDSLFSSH